MRQKNGKLYNYTACSHKVLRPLAPGPVAHPVSATGVCLYRKITCTGYCKFIRYHPGWSPALDIQHGTAAETLNRLCAGPFVLLARPQPQPPQLRASAPPRVRATRWGTAPEEGRESRFVLGGEGEKDPAAMDPPWTHRARLRGPCQARGHRMEEAVGPTE